MSDIFFTDSSEAPVPPEEVRIREFTAVPRPDGRRVDVHAALTPFQKRPNLDLTITDAEGEEAAALSVVEAIDPKMDFTMHLRGPQVGGWYAAELRVFYSDIKEPGTDGESSAGEILRKTRKIVDQRKFEFEVSASE